jgi:hypothetical protein
VWWCVLCCVVSPTLGRAKAASSTLGSKWQNVSYCLWAHSLQQKLTGTPSYEVLKGDKDSAYPVRAALMTSIYTSWLTLRLRGHTMGISRRQ